MELCLDEFLKKNWRRYGVTVALGAVAIVEGAYICSQHNKTAGYLPPQANNPAISQKVSTKDSIPITVDDSDRLTVPPPTATSQDLVGTQVPYSYYSSPQSYAPQQAVVETPLPVIPQAVEPPLPNQALPISGNSESINNADIVSESEISNAPTVTEGKTYTDGRIAYIGGENLNFGNDTSVDSTKKD